MLLNGKPNLNVEENADFILYCALLSNEPLITLNDLRECNIPASERIELAYELYNQPRPTDEKIMDLYQCAVGEAGINPDAVWSMTKEEIDLAYEGYIYRQELSVNLMLMALQRAKLKSWQKIKLLESRDYSIGTEEERQAIFNSLGIEEN